MGRFLIAEHAKFHRKCTLFPTQEESGESPPPLALRQDLREGLLPAPNNCGPARIGRQMRCPPLRSFAFSKAATKGPRVLVVDPKTIRVGGYADAAKGVSIRDCDALTIGRKRRSEGIAFGPFRYANTHVAADAVQVILHYFIRSQNRITLTSTSATTRGFFPADMNDLHQSARQTVCNKFQQLWHSLADASANKSIPVSPTRQRGSGAIQTLLLTLALFKLKNLARRPHVCA